MKKSLQFVFVIAACLMFAGCSAAGESSVSSSEASTEVSTEASSETSSDDSTTTVETAGEPRGYLQISQSDAAAMMDEEGVLILDVREKYEFYEGHIPRAICYAYDKIDENITEVLPDKGQKILVYCRSGRRSKIAAQKLADLGYTNVLEFGGIIDWTGETVLGG